MRTTGVFTFALLSILCVGVCAQVGEAQAEESSTFDDAAILAYFDEMNTTDIWLARMAVHQGVSDEVRGIGRMIVADHEKIQAKARALATKLSIVPRPEPMDHSAVKLAELVTLVQSRTGSDFDRTYLEHELSFSEAFLAMLKERMVPAARRKEVKRFLSTLVPEFEHHVAHMRETAGKVRGIEHGSGVATPSHHHE